MKRRQFVLGAASLAGAAVAGLSGCSGSGSAGSGGSVTLQMVESLTNPARSVVLKKLLSEFEAANPGIKVALVSPPHGAGRPEDPADAPGRQRRGRARGA